MNDFYFIKFKLENKHTAQLMVSDFCSFRFPPRALDILLTTGAQHCLKAVLFNCERSQFCKVEMLPKSGCIHILNRINPAVPWLTQLIKKNNNKKNEIINLSWNIPVKWLQLQWNDCIILINYYHLSVQGKIKHSKIILYNTVLFCSGPTSS